VVRCYKRQTDTPNRGGSSEAVVEEADNGCGGRRSRAAGLEGEDCSPVWGEGGGADRS
jgi:hypothetical protein